MGIYKKIVKDFKTIEEIDKAMDLFWIIGVSMAILFVLSAVLYLYSGDRFFLIALIMTGFIQLMYSNSLDYFNLKKLILWGKL